ncbi:MAG: FAD-dependent 5-carboxymethylaminomethyl-2-thiouridine(34) oxidoreductase MnmC [Pseudomonadota bacterium]
MRLPQRPDLSWKEDGTPVNERVGDSYYSVEDGLEETRAIFLKACGLPERWQGRDSFTVAELGFGTGLNFLALWQLWREARGAEGWLHFVSFEGFPLDARDAAQALSVWPELEPLVRELVAKWPDRAKGVHQVTWPDERLTLTLHLGLIEDTLPQTRFKADAWFLDGFTPAKNEAMWNETLWPLIAERSAPGAIAATFTVAGAVRRGLAAAGFEVAKQPGHGRKRERLEAIFPGQHAARPPNQKRIAVIGAGISGASLARVLRDRGAHVTVYDMADGPAQGTSGNPMGLLMPRLDAGDTAQARFLLEAYNAARSLYRGYAGVEDTEVVQRPKDEQEATRFEKVLADPPLGLRDLEALPGGGLLHKRAMIFRPALLLPALLDSIDVRWGREVDIDPDARSVNGEAYDAIVLATGWHMEAMIPALRLKGRAGQVEFSEVDVDAPPTAMASGHYALASGRQRVWGATYRDHQGGVPMILEDDRNTNQGYLDALNPYWRQSVVSDHVQSRAGVRATSPDRLPVIGPLPDIEAILHSHVGLRKGIAVPEETAALSGVYIAGGYGSRGFTFGPWGARLISALIHDDPLPTRLDVLPLIDPARQVLRDLKRRLI